MRFSKSRVVINGRVIQTDGAITSISATNGRVVVNGRVIGSDEMGGDAPVINIIVEGPVDTVDGDFADIKVTGDAQTVKTVSGDVEVYGSVAGNVKTVSGDVKAGGGIGGSVSTVSGDIRR